ncbi:unnamed protein product [Owenia fusiformis]|uniref:Uncharacterized protein n=1 Tax=Owenia fusiformis TaxID=6347 RepID=A0A8J1YB90_OWEFU|nr:unnamed protein product [Owenia fusiformis]
MAHNGQTNTNTQTHDSLGPEKFIPIYVLGAGVVGGLILVITVILFCKYCIKKKKIIRRQNVIRKHESPNRTTFRPYTKYERVGSFGEQKECLEKSCTSSPTSTRSHKSFHSKSDHDHGDSDTLLNEEDNIDYAVLKYQESLRDNCHPDDDPTNLLNHDTEDEKVKGDQGRRLSFQLARPQENIYVDKDPKRCAFKNSRQRYTDGDFHHLKMTKIDRSLERSPRIATMIHQSSVGGMTGLRSYSLPNRNYRSVTNDEMMVLSDLDEEMNFDVEGATYVTVPYSEQSLIGSNERDVVVEIHDTPGKSDEDEEGVKLIHTKPIIESRRNFVSARSNSSLRESHDIRDRISIASQGSISSRENSRDFHKGSLASVRDRDALTSVRSSVSHSRDTNSSQGSLRSSSRDSREHNSELHYGSMASMRSASRESTHRDHDMRSQTFSRENATKEQDNERRTRGHREVLSSLKRTTMDENRSERHIREPEKRKSSISSDVPSEKGTFSSRENDNAMSGHSRSNRNDTRARGVRSHSFSRESSFDNDSNSRNRDIRDIMKQGRQRAVSIHINCHSRQSSPPKTFNVVKPKFSQSLEVVSPLEKISIKDNDRRVQSYDGELYETKETRRYPVDHLQITQFNNGPFYNADFEVMSENNSPPASKNKVRYNDPGSYEDINNDTIVDDMTLSESDDTDTLNGAQKYRDIWTLRTTLEEEEGDELKDTIMVDCITSPSPDHSPEQEHANASHTTSFESNTEPALYMEESDTNQDNVLMASNNLLHPNYENRRKTYRSILTKRLQRLEPNTSTENSFETSLETDGDFSDTSRHEATTTSFESTTDNTDSTNDSQTHRLQQMKGDSGYKSLETTKSLETQETAPPKNKKQISFADSLDEKDEPKVYERRTSKEYTSDKRRQNSGSVPLNHSFERGKTASKKRREYRKERQLVQVYESINEPETDSKSDQGPSGDSFDDGGHQYSQPPSKFSVFTRFFKSHQKEKERTKSLFHRDYSIDIKTNNIFHEFLREDPYEDSLKLRSSRIQGRQRFHRLHKKHTEPDMLESRRRNKLVPEMRSTSLGSDSSASSVWRLSPQESIEEEYLRSESSRTWGLRRPSEPTKTIHEIPIIKLPTEDEGAEV